MPRLSPIARAHAAHRQRLHRERARLLAGSVAGTESLREAYDACVAHLAANPTAGDQLPAWDEFVGAILGQREISRTR